MPVALVPSVLVSGGTVLDMNPLVGRSAQRGFSLIELMIVLAVVGILIVVGGITMYDSASRNDVLNCAKRIAADIDSARRYAQGSGGRVVVLTSFPGQGTWSDDFGPTDLDGDGNDEFYITFDDSCPNARTGTFISDAACDASCAGDDCTPVLVHGTPGDLLCNGQVVFKKESSLKSSMSSGSSGTITSQSNGMLVFSSTGTLINFGAANRNLYLEKNGMVARLEVVGLTGITRLYVNRPDYEDCGGGTCAVGPNGGTDNWAPLHRSL